MGTLGVNYAVKLAVGRERPASADALIPLPSSSSFPSSHAAMSVAAAFALARARPELGRGLVDGGGGDGREPRLRAAPTGRVTSSPEPRSEP